MYTINKAGVKDVSTIHQLANQIYYPSYQEILSKDQMDFMLEKSYTEKALIETIENNQDFYLLQNSAQNSVGFMAVQNKSSSILRIEKLYLLSSVQGQGCGRLLIDFAAQEALRRSRDTLELNVNRGNKAYYFYLKIGFEVVEEIDIPYFGYVLDDYIMQKRIL